MIMLCKRLSKKQLVKAAAKAIKQLYKWFEKNPKRKSCSAELWYGDVVKVRRDYIVEDVNKAAEKAMKDE